MKIIVVAGTGSGCGKTTVVCRLLKAIPNLGAVKISPREGESRIEWGAGESGKDTDLYLVHGAVRAARIIGPRAAVVPSWELIAGDFAGCRGVVIEGACALDIPDEKYAIFVAGTVVEPTRIERNRVNAAKCDLIIDRSSHSCREIPMDQIRNYLLGVYRENF